jgi:hypothetical protein
MSTLPKRLLAAAAVLFAALALLAGCGGDDGSDADPQELLSETFSGEGQVTSGVLDLSVDASADGEGGGSLTASLSGPFDSRSPDELPLIDLDASADLEAGPDSQSIEGGIVVTEDSAFLTTGGQAYEVDQATYDRSPRPSPSPRPSRTRKPNRARRSSSSSGSTPRPGSPT